MDAASCSCAKEKWRQQGSEHGVQLVPFKENVSTCFLISCCKLDPVSEDRSCSTRGLTEDSDESLLQHVDGRVRMWCKDHENMDPSCYISAAQAAAVMQ